MTTEQDKIQATWSDAARKAALEARRAHHQTEYGGENKYSQQIGEIHGGLAAELTGGHHASTMASTKGNHVHVIEHHDPKAAAQEFHDFVTSDAAQGAVQEKAPVPHNSDPSAWKVRYKDDDGDNHHVIFRHPPRVEHGNREEYAAHLSKEANEASLTANQTGDMHAHSTARNLHDAAEMAHRKVGNTSIAADHKAESAKHWDHIVKHFDAQGAKATSSTPDPDKVTAAEDPQKRSEAAKEGWRHRMAGHLDDAMLGHRETASAATHKDAMKSANDATKAARKAQDLAIEQGNKDAHDMASEVFSEASDAHMKAMHKAAVEKEHGHRQYHAMMSRHLREESNYHADIAKRSPTGDKTQASSPRTVDAILAGAKPGNQNAAGPHHKRAPQKFNEGPHGTHYRETAKRAEDLSYRAAGIQQTNAGANKHHETAQAMDEAATAHDEAWEAALANNDNASASFHKKTAAGFRQTAKEHREKGADRSWTAKASDHKPSVEEILKKTSCNPKP